MDLLRLVAFEDGFLSHNPRAQSSHEDLRLLRAGLGIQDKLRVDLPDRVGVSLAVLNPGRKEAEGSIEGLGGGKPQDDPIAFTHGIELGRAKLQENASSGTNRFALLP